MKELIENILCFVFHSGLGRSFRYSVEKIHSRRNDIKQLGDVLLEVIGIKDPKNQRSHPTPTNIIMV